MTLPRKTNTDAAFAYSVGSAAMALGVSVGSVRRWTDLGHLKSYRTPGGQRRISQEELDDFVARSRAAAR